MYRNAFDSNYEELKTFYPVWYRDVLEMDALWRVLGGHLDQIQDGVVKVIDNSFIATADEESISKLEQFLYITYDGSRTLEDRRIVVGSFFIGGSHIGEQEIKTLTGLFTPGEIDVGFIDATILVTVTRDLAERFNLADCRFILLRKIPAHLRLVFVDNLLPVRFRTKNTFFFKSLAFLSSFYNFGGGRVSLNGDRVLDGSWNLSQNYARGLRFKEFSVELRIDSTFSPGTLALTFGILGIKNIQYKTFTSLEITLRATTTGTFNLPATAFGLRALNANSLSGRITIDTMYWLDGSVNLDGSNKLNANIIEEEL